MKKIAILLTIIFMTFFPINIKAGVMCNDGWTSSCIVSGPGCCSHHGGVADYEEDYDYDDYNGYDYDNNDDGGSYIIIVGIIILIIIGIASS